MTKAHPVHASLLMCAVLLPLLSLPGCESPSKPEFDWTGLLTDEEMHTAPVANAPAENPDWVEWIQGNYTPIRSLDAENFSDLYALVPYLRDKRIVQLGESGHGVAEFSRVKIRLIKFLHEVLHFNVIAFESSLYECHEVDRKAEGLQPMRMMSESIFGVWHTTDVLTLFEYLKRTRDTRKPLRLAGFDIQVSSSQGVADRPKFLRDTIAKVDAALAKRTYDLDSEFLANAFDESYILENHDELVSRYEEVADFFDEHEREFEEAYFGDTEIPRLARQVAWSASRYVVQLYQVFSGSLGSAVETRDRGMAQNVEFLLDELYPRERIIIWAHNGHVCYDLKAVPLQIANSMGKWVADSHRSEMYTVGLYMCRGRAAQNDRSIYNITPLVRGSVESVLYRPRQKYLFIDMLGQERNDGNSWMFESVTAKYWGRADWPLVPRQQYDAILFLDAVTPPRYIGGTSSSAIWPGHLQDLNVLQR